MCQCGHFLVSIPSFKSIHKTVLKQILEFFVTCVSRNSFDTIGTFLTADKFNIFFSNLIVGVDPWVLKNDL